MIFDALIYSAASCSSKLPLVNLKTFRIFFQESKRIGVVNNENLKKNLTECIKSLKDSGARNIGICNSLPHDLAAQAAGDALYSYKPCDKINVKMLTESTLFDREWIKSNAQNFARKLADTPSNLMTPSIFAEEVQKNTKLQVSVHDEEWARKNNMNLFCSVAGNSSPLRFLEITLKNSEMRPIVLVGKGICFDSGGISIKPSKNMSLMKGDMAGGAAVVAATLAAEKLDLKLNLRTLVPLCENMPGPNSVKPGDVISNGLKSVEILDTDAEGRLILADALHYARKFKPEFLISVSTLTGAMNVALGQVYGGVFSTDKIWTELQKASLLSGDLLWRMPFHSDYLEGLKSDVADLANISKFPADACAAAAFLNEFVPKDVEFAHIDIAGIMNIKDNMTGRPTRALCTLLELLQK